MREQTPDIANEFANFTWPKALRYVLGGLAIGLGLGFIGPYGTYQALDADIRVFFWMSSVSLGWVEAIFFSYALRGFTVGSRFEGWPTLVAATIITTIPVYFQVLFLADLVEGFVRTPKMEEKVTLPSVYFIVLFCMIIQWMIIERWRLVPNKDDLTQDVIPQSSQAEVLQTTSLVPSRVQEAPLPSAEKAELPHPAIRLKDMPKDLMGDILCIRVEDHYLRITTTQGEGLILKRMKDAVAELDACDGMQVHRSWWVARSAVMQVETVSRQKILILTNGLEVPVSRTYLPSLKAHDWVL